MTDPVRVRLDLAYDGGEFSGWATQPGRRTVQGILEAALGQVLRTDPVALTVAGRTDAGVHARGQVAHFDLPSPSWRALAGRTRAGEPAGPDVSAAALVRRLAGVLPPDIVVRAVTPVPPAFDARFSALWRRYRYRIVDDPAHRDPLRRADTVTWRHRLDEHAMTAAGAGLLGLRDFAAFCKLRDGRTSVRTLLDCSWTRDDEGVLVATVRADAFCHSMVRFLIGAMVPVGEGRRGREWPARVLDSGQRDPAAVVMPAHGLSLEQVAYPAEDGLADRARQTRAVRTLEPPTPA